MATAIAAAGLGHLRLSLKDIYTDTGSVSIPLQSSAADAVITGIVDAYVKLTNAVLTKAEFNSRAITGFTSAVSANAWEAIGFGLAMSFQGADPINASKTITRVIVIPAPKKSMKQADPSALPDFTNGDLGALVTLLTANLAIVDGTGVTHYGGLALIEADSKFVMLNDVLGPE